jgi:hydroxymethylglutaryl-CoA reductase
VYMGHVCGVLERQTSCEQSQAEICGSTDTKQEPVCSNVIVIRTQYVTKRQTKVAQLCIVRLTKRKPYQQLRVDLMYTIQGSICVVQMRYF